MRFCLLPLMLLLLSGCEPGAKGQRKDGSTTTGKFDRCIFEGHTYITYTEGSGANRTKGITHDPDCPACR